MIRIWITLLCITLLGSGLRYINLSPFKLYPDSYQSLIVAKNILDYHSVLGYLGTNGILYPDIFSWTHPVYPLLIDFFTIFTPNTTFVAQMIASLAGVAAIPLAFFMIRNVYQTISVSDKVKPKTFEFWLFALVGAMFIAFSFNHTVWSGFIMTETMGVCMMLLFLLAFFSPSVTRKFGDPITIISGVLFALAILTRYEYALISLPIALFLFMTGKQFMRLFTLLIACGLTLLIFVWLLYPLPSTFTVIGEQLGSLLLREGFFILILFLIGLVGIFLAQKISHKFISFGSFFLVGILWLVSLYLVVQYFFGSSQWILYTDLAALRHFLIDDFFLSIFSLFGFFLLIKNAKTKALGTFSLFSSLCLFIIYHRINPDMERYITHLMPFLLIPASYAFVFMSQKLLALQASSKKKFFISLIALVFLLVMQITITFLGMRYTQDTSWYRISYDDKAAELSRKYLPANKNILLIASYPEPYFYELHIPTQSIADSSPYIYLDGVASNQKIMIIEDMGMHADFPHFTSLLDKQFSQYKIAYFWVHEKFHYINTVTNETSPIVIYELNLKELQRIINMENKN